MYARLLKADKVSTRWSSLRAMPSVVAVVATGITLHVCFLHERSQDEFLMAGGLLSSPYYGYHAIHIG